MWYHFQFTSGANPYVSFTKANAKTNIEYWEKTCGYKVDRVEENFYLVHDKETNESDKRW